MPAQNATHFEEWNGFTATVVAGFAPRKSIDMNAMKGIVIYACRVQLEDAVTYCAMQAGINRDARGHAVLHNLVSLGGGVCLGGKEVDNPQGRTH